MSEKIGSISDYFGVIEPYDEFFALTKNTGLIAAIEISGRDPDGLNAVDHASLSAIAQRIYGKLNRNIVITQYYAHFDGTLVSFKNRDNPISNTLSKSREQFLNSKNLPSSKIVHYLEIEPEENINKLNIFSALKHIASMPFDKRSREILKNSISFDNTFLLELDELARMRSQLQGAIDEIMAKWNGLCQVKQLNIQSIWAHMRFLASLNQNALTLGDNELVPDEDLDIYLSPGDIKTVIVNEMDLLKIAGATNRYAKLASVRRFSNQRGKMVPGLFAANPTSPTRIEGNYLIMTRWKPLSEFQKDYLFQRKHTDLERASLDFTSLFTGGESRSILEKQAAMKGTIKAKIQELDIAESVPDLWGTGHSYICIFGADPVKLNETTVTMNAALSNAKINVTWESITADKAFKALQPAQRLESNRNLFLTSSQFAAASLIYKSSTGNAIVPDLNDEAVYVFQSKDGQPFYFSPIIGGKSLLVAVGRIRSGKTFAKNTIASNFQKYNGLYRAVDIDPGTEPVANLFGGGIFRVSNERGYGFNFFASYKEKNKNGEEDTAFKIHAMQLLIAFLKANDAEENRSLNKTEQKDVEKALDATLELPKELRTLAALVGHMPLELRMKFSRWVRSDGSNKSTNAGWFAHLFDQDVDAIGNIDEMLAVFNLQALKSTPALLAPIQIEILYRITQAFEDPALRHKPKLLDLDECHYPLSIPGFAEYIDTKIRTWGKWFGSIQMWTQSPEELIKATGWQAIRGAATTFLFFADPQMDVEVYKEAFPFLTSGELDAIKDLIPQRECYIIQPEIGVSKILVLQVEDAQYVINTSHPREAAIRDKLVEEHGFQRGIELAAEAIRALKDEAEEKPEEIVVSRLNAA